MDIELTPEFDIQVEADVSKNELTILGEPSALYTALAKAQSRFKAVEETKTVKVTPKQGRPYSYQYADLTDYLDMVRPCLNREQVFLSQTTTRGRVQTILAGHGATVIYTTEFGNTDIPPQQQGSLFSYYKRYSLIAALAVASGGEDVDADDLNDDIVESNIVPIMTKPRSRETKEDIKTIAEIRKELEYVRSNKSVTSIDQFVISIQGVLAAYADSDPMDHASLIQEINAVKKELSSNG